MEILSEATESRAPDIIIKPKFLPWYEMMTSARPNSDDGGACKVTVVMATTTPIVVGWLKCYIALDNQSFGPIAGSAIAGLGFAECFKRISQRTFNQNSYIIQNYPLIRHKTSRN